MSDTYRRWDARMQEWHDVPVTITPEPRRRRARRARTRRQGSPRNITGLSDGSPIPAWWRDTAFAPSDGLADMRRHIEAPAMRTHRTAVTLPADPGRITVTR